MSRKISRKKQQTSYYKWIKDIYANLDKIKEEIEKIKKWIKVDHPKGKEGVIKRLGILEKEVNEIKRGIYELKLDYGSNARRIKRIELKLGLKKKMKGQRR